MNFANTLLVALTALDNTVIVLNLGNAVSIFEESNAAGKYTVVQFDFTTNGIIRVKEDLIQISEAMKTRTPEYPY